MKLVRILAFAIASLAASPSFAAEEAAWSEWRDDLFSRARSENRFVILDLEAVWCHWCHVMDVTTYRDPKVTEPCVGNASRYLAEASFTVFMQSSAEVPPITMAR